MCRSTTQGYPDKKGLKNNKMELCLKLLGGYMVRDSVDRAP